MGSLIISESYVAWMNWYCNRNKPYNKIGGYICLNGSGYYLRVKGSDNVLDPFYEFLWHSFLLYKSCIYIFILLRSQICVLFICFPQRLLSETLRLAFMLRSLMKWETSTENRNTIYVFCRIFWKQGLKCYLSNSQGIAC